MSNNPNDMTELSDEDLAAALADFTFERDVASAYVERIAEEQRSRRRRARKERSTGTEASQEATATRH